jgi:hypothetical protein
MQGRREENGSRARQREVVPMEDFVAGRFIRLIAEQCRFAIMASKDIDASMKEIKDSSKSSGPVQPEEIAARRKHEDIVRDRFWLSLQTFVVSAGNVSKVLWPTRPEFAARGVELRALLAVKDDSVLSSRVLRNRLEHIDEWVSKWEQRTGGLHFADRIFAPVSNEHVHEEDIPVFTDISFRSYDPQKGIVSFQGDTFELLPIHAALKEPLNYCTNYH